MCSYKSCLLCYVQPRTKSRVVQPGSDGIIPGRSINDNEGVVRDIITEAEMLDEPGGDRLRFRFEGSFEGRQVRWDTTLLTLKAWSDTHPEQPARQNFIDIAESDTASGIPITVGLNLPYIDLPAVRKTMMMIRQYKRLRRGRHNYGPSA